MELNASTWWWLIAGALVAIELATGTFYLLMLAIGCVAGAMAAHLGLGITGQLFAAALLGGGAVALWHMRRSEVPKPAADAHNPDLHQDIGAEVVVERWADDGTARVTYRGAGWDVRYAGDDAPMPGHHVVRAMDGSRLLVDRAPSH